MTTTPLYLTASAIMLVDPDSSDTASVDFSGALAGTGDTLSSCQVSVVSGTMELATTLLGTYSTADVAAVVSGNLATIAYRGALRGTVETRWRGATAQGRTGLDETRWFKVNET